MIKWFAKIAVKINCWIDYWTTLGQNLSKAAEAMFFKENQLPPSGESRKDIFKRLKTKRLNCAAMIEFLVLQAPGPPRYPNSRVAEEAIKLCVSDIPTNSVCSWQNGLVCDCKSATSWPKTDSVLRQASPGVSGLIKKAMIMWDRLASILCAAFQYLH